MTTFYSPTTRLASTLLLLLCSACQPQKSTETELTSSGNRGIDRKSLVTRHHVTLDHADTLGSLSVGNGQFSFTVDVSGLQTFYEDYENGMALGTQSQWAWHAIPADQSYTLADVEKHYPGVGGRVTPYAVQHKTGKAGAASAWLRANPHRLHMGLIGLILIKKNGDTVVLNDLQHIQQTLDLWNGKITSQYEIEGEPVSVELYADASNDGIGVRINSPLAAANRLKVFLKFPYGATCHTCAGYDFTHPEKHTTKFLRQGPSGVTLERTLDDTKFYVHVGIAHRDAELVPVTEHVYHLLPMGESFSFTVLYTPQERASFLKYETVEKNCQRQWPRFWLSGGAIDFSGCTDPRAAELERRVILSQYLTKIQCSGTLPPQETGLTMNSWYGKFHLEMHWWHGVHFALWSRLNEFERSVNWYNRILQQATATAARQGYDGARWPKMTSPSGRESPSDVGVFLVWQQPHPIYYAELFYRQNPTLALARYKEMVSETAAFMASFARYNSADKKYHLYHPLIPAQEIFPAAQTDDPPFELAYWRYGLQLAQQWRERAGMPRNPQWDAIIHQLALPVEKDGYYLPAATAPDAYTNPTQRRDHPMAAGTFGMIPWASFAVDTAAVAHTLEETLADWQWATTWGWDYPMLAMAAARLGKPNLALDLLLKDTQKNTYLINGHNYQDKRLRLYLPGNGGLLTAVAMMAAGWDGATSGNPGFPDDGQWDIVWENLQPMP